MNDRLNIFDSNYFDDQEDHDPLLEIAIDIVADSYRGIVVHHLKLACGESFYGINFREDTHEGLIFSQIQTDFYRGRAIPSSASVLKEIQEAYARKE
jgi:hypothetical protein